MNKSMKTIIATLALLCAGVVGATTNAIPWRVERYSLTAREMPVREALETFGVAEGVPVVSSKGVSGVFSGTFKDIPAGEFLDRVATVQNLAWYYDGASLYVYASSEVQSLLVELQYMKGSEVSALLRQLGVEDPRFPIKTAANDEIMMVSGPPRYVSLITELIERADKLRESRTFTEMETRIFHLRHTWADSVSFSATSPESSPAIKGMASILMDLMKVEETMRDGTNSFDQLEHRIEAKTRPVIMPDNRMNAVIVRDVASRMPMYERLISELDVPQRLLEINVTVLEMSKNNALDWQLSLKVSGAQGEFSGTGGMNVDNLFSQSSLYGAGAAGALSYLGKNVTVDGSIQALRQKGKARSISKMSLLTVDNLAAEISDTQSYHARLIGKEVADLQEVSAGTTLQIKPRILTPLPDSTNRTTSVWLAMKLTDGGFQSVNVEGMPLKRQSTLTTQASVPEDFSIMLAGYYRDVDDEAGWGIPYLRDIPWIGWLFGGASVNKETVQRLFVVSPHIITLDYEVCKTQSVAEAQLVRQRDLCGEEALIDAAARNDSLRKEREARIDEMLDIREEQADESYDRFRKERKLRTKMRERENEKAHEAWKQDFYRREEEWGKESEKAPESQKELVKETVRDPEPAPVKEPESEQTEEANKE